MRVLVLGAGGAAANGFCRALRMAGNYHLIGANINADDLELAETDEKHLVGTDDHSLWDLCWKAKPDFVHAQPEEEVRRLSRMRNTIGANSFLPYPWVIESCQDKWLTYQRLSEYGVPVPETRLVSRESDLHGFASGPKWLRATMGAGGAGAICTDDRSLALAWIRRHNGLGKFTIADVLTADTVTVQQLWWRGELIASQQRLRRSWANAKNSPTGVSGSTGVGVTSSDTRADDIADEAVFAVADKPHGLFGIDMALDHDGLPRVTEINVGRFFTTAPEFFAQAGFNMAYVYVKWGMGDRFWEGATPWRNPIRDGRKWIRGMDSKPMLVEPAPLAFAPCTSLSHAFDGSLRDAEGRCSKCDRGIPWDQDMCGPCWEPYRR